MTADMRRQVAAEVEAAERELDELDRDDSTAPPVRARRQAKEPSQVYSIRVPVDRLEELRSLAEARGETPSGLMRRWVLERLASEVSGEVGGSALTREALLETMDEAVTQALMKRGLLDLSAGATRLEVEAARYRDPSGPVRLGVTRRLARAGNLLSSNEEVSAL